MPLFFPLHYQGGTDHLRGGRDVEQKGFSLIRRNQDRGLRQKQFDHVKRPLGLGCPFEVISLFSKVDKGGDLIRRGVR